MAHRGYGGMGDFDGQAIDPALLGVSDNASTDYMTEDESNASNAPRRDPYQTYAQQDYANSLQTGPAAFPTGRTPYTGSYQELAAQGMGTGPYHAQPARTLPQVNDEQFQMSFDDLTTGPIEPPAFSEFKTREPVVPEHSRLVGWYIRPQIDVPGIGGVVPIESPYDIPELGNFPPSNLATPTGPPSGRPNPPRRRSNPATPIQDATMTPFADPANLPQGAVQAHGIEGREDPGTVHKGSVIQPCICYVGRKEEIKRPPNAWILYRSATFDAGQRFLEQRNHPKGTGAGEVSKVCSSWWKKLSKADKAPWEQKAREMDEEHKRLYPGWKYDPGAVQKQRFGTVDCRCGAYEYNMNQRRLRAQGKAQYPGKQKKGPGRPRKRADPSMDEDEVEVEVEDDDDDSDDAFLPPAKKAKGPSRTTSQAMDEDFQDFPTPTQQTYQEDIDARRASRQQTPPRILRAQPNISYAEPPDEGFEDTDMSGTDGNRDFDMGDFAHHDLDDDFVRAALLNNAGTMDMTYFDMDSSYAPPAARLSRLGRRSRRADASRPYYAR
ncbi:hypothetical protein AC578_1971 [Pseudocercospora eumusae]|uniref:HMG box domain-containing protein n=1 Tax=Pseudocercospora eumusae TaxID=321146 RepID=A0A139H283_9PEZI|nr:hypothetical protein AC578_1971 [Pseudocercospora eumusae]